MNKVFLFVWVSIVTSSVALTPVCASLGSDVAQSARDRIGGHYKYGFNTDTHGSWHPYTYEAGIASHPAYACWVYDLSYTFQPNQCPNPQSHDVTNWRCGSTTHFSKDCESWARQDDGVTAMSDCTQHGHYDCTGLVWVVLNDAQEGLPSALFPTLTINNRRAQDMYDHFAGEKTTDLSRARPGDVVFFASCRYRTSSPATHIQHAGIYVGEGNVISCEGSPCTDLALSGNAPGVRQRSFDSFNDNCDPTLEPGSYDNPKGAFPYSIGRLSETPHFDCAIPEVKCGFSSDLCVYLKDETGNAIAGRDIHLEIDGKSADPVSGSDGKVCIAWTPSKSGDYKLYATFHGDSTYEASSKECPFHVDKSPSQVTVSDQTTNCSDPFSLSACLTVSDPVPLPGATLHLSVNGVTYADLTTGSDGCVKTEQYYSCYKSLTVGTYQINASYDGSDCYLPSSNTATLTVKCDPTDMSDQGWDHSVQYSDPIELGAMLKDDEDRQLTGKPIRFRVGSQEGWDFTGDGDAKGCEADDITAGRDGYADYTMTINQPRTDCVPITSDYWFAGDNCYCEKTLPVTVNITCETATIEPHWEELVRCDGSIQSGATTTIGAYLTEESDRSYGDITKPGDMVFDFYTEDEYEKGAAGVPFDTKRGKISQVANPHPTTDGPQYSGYAEVTIPLKEGLYWVRVHLDDCPSNAYYCAEAMDNCLVIYCDGFVTGGGWITCTDGVKKNFGFNLKYKKQSGGNTPPQGSLQYNDHALGIRLHCKTWDWLSVDEINRVAWFQGHGTVNGSGAFDVYVKVTDIDEPGHPQFPGDMTFDTFTIRFNPHGGNTFPYPCPDPDICPIQGGEYVINDCPLGGGNIQIHKPRQM